MSGQRFILLLIVAAIAISGAFFLSTQRNPLRQLGGIEFLPSFAGEMNSVTAVIVRKAGESTTMHKVGSQWTVAERGDYLADVAKLRKLLLALRDARIIEEKTSDPARYGDIGVEDPSLPGATGAEITVISPTAKHDVIVGKPVGEGSFVRRAGEKQSYSIEPAINFETEPRFWIDSRLTDVRFDLIQIIEVKLATGETYSIHRLNPGDDSFGLDGVPAGRKPLEVHALAPAPTMLADLAAEDVSPAAAIDFSRSSQVIVTLNNGNVLTLTGAVIVDKHWIEVKSSQESALTAKAQGRAFEVASYRYDAIFRPLEQLLVPKETRAPKAAAAAAASLPAPKKPVSAPAS